MKLDLYVSILILVPHIEKLAGSFTVETIDSQLKFLKAVKLVKFNARV